jgi:hypothetical protein
MNPMLFQVIAHISYHARPDCGAAAISRLPKAARSHAVQNSIFCMQNTFYFALV